MSDFIIRVLLHNARAEHYADLQRKLEDIGMVDVILGMDGKRYKLPPAEYMYQGGESAETVRAACWNAARSTGCDCAVLVTQALDILWIGLAETPPIHALSRLLHPQGLS